MVDGQGSTPDECTRTLVNFVAFEKSAYLLDELYRIVEIKEFA